MRWQLKQILIYTIQSHTITLNVIYFCSGSNGVVDNFSNGSSNLNAINWFMSTFMTKLIFLICLAANVLWILCYGMDRTAIFSVTSIIIFPHFKGCVTGLCACIIKSNVSVNMLSTNIPKKAQFYIETRVKRFWK